MPRQDGYRPSTSPTTHRRVWLVVVIFFVGGDVLTTGLGLSVAGVVERNAVLAPLVADHGMAAILLLKGIVVGGGYLCYRVLPDPHDIGVPLGFATVGMAVTGWNLLVLGTAILA